MRIHVYFIITLVIFYSCRKDNHSNYNDEWGVYNPTTYKFPNAFSNSTAIIEPEWNKTTNEGVELGRYLYYDTILSTNGRSCSSCHIQQFGFSSFIEGPFGYSIPSHANLGWSERFGWNGTKMWLDSVAFADLEENNEFLKANNQLILERLQKSSFYQKLFWKAFGVEIVNVSQEERKKWISYALAQFMRTQISYNSKFDKYLRGETALTEDELMGYQIFMDESKGDCFHCHGNASNPLWTDNQIHNNGLTNVFNGIDLGYFLVSGNEIDKGKFKTPTLRNVELTAPYMHDGRFQTLEEVVSFYSSGLVISSTVDPLMKNVWQGGAQLNPIEQSQLVAFLKTLTDNYFLIDSNLSNPN